MSIAQERIEPINACPAAAGSRVRPRVSGKFLFAGEEKLYIRGVTYGAFRPDDEGNEYHDLEVLHHDFAAMAACGLNAVRIPHTMPPRALLDVAQQHGLRVMVGLSAEQYVGFLIDSAKALDIEALIRDRVRVCAGHPALLCYALGNEVPASIVRWLGPEKVERYLRRIFATVKDEDPDGLVTYVNYPTTEYLRLPFLDIVSFNVYLEHQDQLARYLARLQNLAGERPLLMSELGLDSLRHGEDGQARAVEWQIRTAFAGGCAGAFVFAWTDEWHRAGAEVDDWAFGLTDRARHPKPALNIAREVFSEVPFPPKLTWPRISVVVCSYNGEGTIRECLEGLASLDYPDFEVIVVDDGSTDTTASIAAEYGFRVISTENRGLSSARNTGLEATTGEIVAYTDDDACPDPHWLTYLAATFMTTSYVGVGGPNIAPRGQGLIADCVTHAPGGPAHVLLSDRDAEHIPGCNMAFRKEALQAIGGFDPQFRAAGDDVDVCWRLQEKGWKLGFSPAAMVWHRRRNSVRAYWKQQVGYGKAEALLERKWPEKYNSSGHLSWTGRLYGRGLTAPLGWGSRIYHGMWGAAPFQSLYEPSVGNLRSLALMPEWYLLVAALAFLGTLGFIWDPLRLALPLMALAAAAVIAQAAGSAARAAFVGTPRGRVLQFEMRMLTAFLHLVQPMARLVGRLRLGLTPWRQRGVSALSLPIKREWAVWTERWVAPEERLRLIEEAFRAAGVVARRGGDFDRWDLELRGGLFGAARLLMAVEDHGAGTQLVRFRAWPTCRTTGVVFAVLFAVIALIATLDGVVPISLVLWALSAAFAVKSFHDCSSATAAIRTALRAG
jgi:GT2 family glycosyltransferase